MQLTHLQNDTRSVPVPRSLTFTLIFLAGWTVAANLTTLFGGTLETLIWAGLACAALLGALYRFLPPSTAFKGAKSDSSPWSPTQRQTNSLVLAACIATLSLAVNWYAFWCIGVTILVVHCALAFRHASVPDPAIPASARLDRLVILVTMLGAGALSLMVNRSDADDAFYVGLAAFTHAHPNLPLLAVDPMHGEPGWPLLFPSYRFASYELLAASIAKLLGMPAMSVMYRLLPPLGAAFVVASAFFLAQQLAPRRWLLVGLVTLALGLILGECHRGFGNFMFVRIFQGKSIYVSALMPLIFALTFRCISSQGTARDVMLLACAQVAAIGLSNFGMLAAPMAAGTALVACALTAPRAMYPRLGAVACTLLIPLPYLLYVAIASQASSNLAGTEEAAPAVWLAVFGPWQQYLVALLLLTAPALTWDGRTRAWLAVPPLILLGVLLNPWLAAPISHYITTTPVYWRVTWCFPVLSYMAWGIFAASQQWRQSRIHRLLSILIILLLSASLAFTVLRPSNEISWHFAGVQVPPMDYLAAERAARDADEMTRILAPEPVSSVIARFEDHPRLVLVRDMYLPMFRPGIGEKAFLQRMTLRNFVNGAFRSQDASVVSTALGELNVKTVVTMGQQAQVSDLLAANGYILTETVGPYGIWRRPAASMH